MIRYRERAWVLPVMLVAGGLCAAAQTSTPEQGRLTITSVVPTEPLATGADNRVNASASRPLSSSGITKDYRIGVDDVLTISVWHEPDLSRSIPVRPDGRISLPLVGEVEAAGKTPPQLEAELRSDLSQFVKNPELTVIVAEIRSRRVNIIGQVMHPGAFSITQQMGVLDALAEAGGLRDFAKKKKIYVLRETSAGRRTRIPFDYVAVLNGRRGSQDLLLQTNDTVVVP
jgi:polysaccharide export outer membrane protein